MGCSKCTQEVFKAKVVLYKIKQMRKIVGNREERPELSLNSALLKQRVGVLVNTGVI